MAQRETHSLIGPLRNTARGVVLAAPHELGTGLHPWFRPATHASTPPPRPSSLNDASSIGPPRLGVMGRERASTPS